MRAQRRKTDSKPTRAMLYGNLQEKCRTPSPQEPCCMEIYRKNAGPQAHKSHVVWKFIGKMPDPFPRTPILCEPAQSKRTWTFHKSHFVWKFTGNMPDPPVNTSIEHRAFYPYGKNAFSVATVFGELLMVPSKMLLK